MFSSKNHIIDKVFLEVNTTNEKTAYKIQNDISSFLNSEVFPKLEKLLDKYDFNGQVFRVDTLDIDFSMQDWDRPEELKFELLKSIEQKIDETAINYKTDITIARKNSKIKNRKESDESVKQLISYQENYRKTILFFLKNGYLPWFGKEEYLVKLSSNKLWKKSLKQTKLFTELKELFRNNTIAVERFVLQLSDEQILAFILSLEIVQVKSKSEIVKYINDLPAKTRKLFIKLLLQTALNTTTDRAEFVEFVKLQLLEKETHELTNERIEDWNLDLLSVIRHFFSEDTNSEFFRLSEEETRQIAKEIELYKRGTHVGAESEKLEKTNLENKPTILLQEFVNSEKEPPFFDKDRNEIVVQNAGLVLFHPFIKAFFSQFGWVNDDGEIMEEHRLESVQALHYCATGNDSFFEPNLILEKFLCDVPLNTPIPYNSLLSKQVKIDAEVMAIELINHWATLKNTSPDGLREMFIHRNGKLIQKQNDFRLIVERKVQDILLDKLPWNISIVKLPWKKNLLFVEW